MRRLFIPAIFTLLLSGCFGPSDGVAVPTDEIYFPVGLALDSDNSHLVVVSSDFDLQYNGGAVQSYQLESAKGKPGLLDQLMVRCNVAADCASGDECRFGLCSAPGGSPCGALSERDAADQVLYPGRCHELDQTKFIVDEVKTGAFATDAIIRQRPTTPEKTNGAPERLFIPVRGDATLHWIDLQDGKLDCGQDFTTDNSCNSDHRSGNEDNNPRKITLDTEPFGIDADERGEVIALTNQTTGKATLFTNRWSDQNGPVLQFALSSDHIPARPVAVAALPQTLGAGETAQPATFLMTFRDAAQVRLFRYVDDGWLLGDGFNGSDPARPYLIDGGGITIDSNSVGTDSRGIGVDGSARLEAKQRCAAGDTDCLNTAALVPLDVFVANRAPATLLIGRTRPPQEYPYFFDTIPLSAGPSRVVVGQVKTAQGTLETRVFVVCFDSRRIFIYDPHRHVIEADIFTGRGPHALAIDTQHALLFVGHFTDSYVGVYSLDLSSPATYGTELGMLGTPKAPRSSK